MTSSAWKVEAASRWPAIVRARRHSPPCRRSRHAGSFDLNGDRGADVFTYDARTEARSVDLRHRNGGFRSIRSTWSPEWEVSAADFNGDRRGDLLLYNRRTGQWFQAIFAAPGAFAYASGIWDPGLTLISTF